MPLMFGFFVVSLLTAGYMGAERIWYLRIWRGLPVVAGDVVRFTRRLLARYLLLGIVVSVPFLPFIVLFRDPGDDPVRLAAYVVVTIAFDLALTFATPALAFTTYDPVQALKINFLMIKNHWPTSGWYMFVPSFAALLLLRSLPRDFTPTEVLIPLTIAGILANLLFKGATAAFYIRHHLDVPDDGAVDMSPPRSVREAPKTTAL